MDIGTLTGTIAIEDQFSGVFSIAQREVEKFADSFGGALGDIAKEGGIAVTAISAITGAITALGVKGSEVNDVGNSFVRLSGSVGAASADIEAMRKGVVGTIDDLKLMTDANHLLAVGAVETAQDFGTLTAAARTLSIEGFGSTAEMLNGLSSAMETGRTRRLALMGITVDTKAAEAEYAAELGVSTGELDKSQKLTADRQAILEALNRTVQAAGDQEVTFAERISQGKVAMENWFDSLAKSVATSPAVNQALKDISDGFSKVFSDSGQTAIQGITAAINVFSGAVSDTVPVVVKLGEGIGALGKTVADYREVVETGGVAWLTYGVATGKVLPWILELSEAIGPLGAAITGLGGVMGVWSTLVTSVVGVGMTAFNGILLTLTETIGASAAATTLLVAGPFALLALAVGGIYVAYEHWTLSSETQRAQQDVINKAISEGADKHIQYGDAVKYVTDQSIRHGQTIVSVTDAITDLGSQTYSTTEKVNIMSTAVRAASHDGQLNTTTMQQIAAAVEKSGIAYKDLSPEIQHIIDGMKIEKDTMDAATEAQNALNAAKNAAAQAEKDQQKLIDSGVQKLNEYLRAVQPLTDAQKQWITMAHAAGETTAEIIAGTDMSARSVEAYTKTLDASKSASEAQQKALQDALKQQDLLKQGTSGLTDAQKTSIQQMQALGLSVNEIGAILKINTTTVGLYEKQWAALLDTMKKVEGAGPKSLAPPTLENLGGVGTGIQGLPSYETLREQGFGGNLLPSTSGVGGTTVGGVGVTTDIANWNKGIGVGNLQGQPGLSDQTDAATTVKGTMNSLKSLSGSFNGLGSIIGGTTGKEISGLGKDFSSASQQVQTFSKMLPKGETATYGGFSVLGSSAASGADKIAAGASLVTGAIGAIGSAKSALQQGSALGRGIGMAETGASVGTMIMPGIGTAVGAAAGLIVGLVSATPKWKQATNQVSNAYGVNVSQTTGQAIADSAKTDYGGSEQASAVGHLSDIIKEAGGVNDTNLAQLTARLHDTYSMIQTGQMTVAQGTKVLDDNFADFAKTGTDSYGVLNKSLVDIIKLNDQFGTQSKAVLDYLSGQGSDAVKQFGTALSIPGDAIKKQQDDTAQLADLYDQLGSAGSESQEQIQAQIQALNADLDTQNGIISATAVTSQSTADALAAGVGASFSAMIAGGMSFSDAVVAITPSIEGLKAEMDNAGLSGSAVFNALQSEVALYSDAVAGPALQATDALSKGIVDLGNMGQLTQDSFTSLTTQIGVTFTSLTNQGYDSKAVMAGMQDSLQRVWEEEQTYGYKADDVTQSLIDQAVAAGEVGEKHKTVNDQMLDATNQLVKVMTSVATVLGATIPAAAETGAADVQKALDSVKAPSLTVKVGYDTSGAPASAASTGGLVTPYGVVQYLADGGTIFQPQGTDTVPAMLTPGERVLSVAETERYDAENQASLNTLDTFQGQMATFQQQQSDSQAAIDQMATDQLESQRLAAETAAAQQDLDAANAAVASQSSALAAAQTEAAYREELNAEADMQAAQAAAELAQMQKFADAKSQTLALQAQADAANAQQEMMDRNRQMAAEQDSINTAMKAAQAAAAASGVQYMADGGTVLPFTPNGSDTVPAMLTPGEQVLSTAQSQQYQNDQNSDEPTTSDVVDAIAGLRGDLTTKLPRALARSLHTALVGVRVA